MLLLIIFTIVLGTHSLKSHINLLCTYYINEIYIFLLILHMDDVRKYIQ